MIIRKFGIQIEEMKMKRRNGCYQLSTQARSPVFLTAFLLASIAGPLWAQVDCDANADLTLGTARAESGLVEVELRAVRSAR